MAMNKVLICVTGPDILIFSPYSETLNWVISMIEKKTKGFYKEVVDGDRPGWKRIKDFGSNLKAINTASNLIVELLDNGWVHKNFSFYVDGHWFQKG